MWGVARWQAVEYGLPAPRPARVLVAERRRPRRHRAWRWSRWTSTGSPTRSWAPPWACCCWAWFTHWTQWFCHAGYVPEQAGSPRSGVRGRLLAAGESLGAALVLGSAAPASAEEADPCRPTAQVPDHRPRLAELSGLVAVGRPGARHQRRRRPGGRLPPRRRLPGRRRAHRRGRPLRPGGPGRRRRRHRLAGRHGRQQRQPADGGAPRAAAGRHHRRLPADLSRRPARRRGAAARAGRHALPRHQGGAGRERRLPPGLGAGGRRNGRAGRGRRGQPHLTGTPAARSGGPASCSSPGERSRRRHALALRTYTDAYVWPLAGSDIPGALAAAPVRIPLPDSPQGEAISFTADNLQPLVASEGLPSDVTVVPLAGGVTPRPGRPPLGDVPEPHRPHPFRALTDHLGGDRRAVATVVVWIGGKLRRPDRPPPLTGRGRPTATPAPALRRAAGR